MKRFKDLRECLILEAEYNPWGYQSQSIHQDDGVHQNLADKEKLGKLNAFIENFLSGQHTNPKARLEQLKIRLNHIGLNFNSKRDTLFGTIIIGTIPATVTHCYRFTNLFTKHDAQYYSN